MKMKAKILSSIGLSFLIAIFLINFVSAGIDFVNVAGNNSQDVMQGNQASITFQLQEDGYGNFTNISVLSPISLTGAGSFNPSLSVSGLPNEINQSQTSGIITVNFTIPNNQTIGEYSGDITVNGNYTNNLNYTLHFTITVTSSSQPPSDDFCGVDFGLLDSNMSNPGDLKVKIENIDNNGIGKDDEWYPSDNISVEVKIENNGNDDINDVYVEYGLWSKETDEWVIEPDDVKKFDLNDGKDKTVEFTIDLYDDLDIDLNDLEDGDYKLYIRARGEVDDDNNTETCYSKSENTQVLVNNDLVVLDDIKLIGTSFCGNTIQIAADILNIGSDDQNDVYIMIHNYELNLNEKADVGDIDSFDDKKLNFEFSIPSDAEEKIYNIVLDVYDENDDIYESDDNDESSYKVSLNVSGNCIKIPDASVYASLESGGKAGKEMEIKATIKNTGKETQTFNVECADYSSWAELINITPENVTLNANESKDVIITFKVDRDAKESQNFNIALTSGDGETITQPVAVTIEKAFSLPSLISENPYLWGIALTSVVLIILIIIVAVRASRR